MSLLLSDSLTESSDKALSAHAPGTGGTWVQYSTPTIAVLAAEGRARGSDAAMSAVYYNAGASAANVSVAATVRRTTAAANEAMPAVFARLQTTGDNRYFATHTGTVLLLQKRVGGATTTLATVSTAFPVDTDCALELRVNGQELICLWNGAVAASATDSSITGAGFVGIGCRLNGRIDDVLAQTIAWELAPADGAHGCTADASAVAVRYALGPADGRSECEADGTVVTMLFALVPDGAAHGMTSGAAAVMPSLGPPGAGVVEAVAGDARVLRVGGEARWCARCGARR